MNYGLLWYDGDKKKTLAQKVEESARHFKKKFGRTPESCLINPRDAENLTPENTPNPVMVDGHPVHLASWKGIVPGHLCLGFEKETEPLSPEPKEPEVSDAALAFERHAQRVAVRS